MLPWILLQGVLLGLLLLLHDLCRNDTHSRWLTAASLFALALALVICSSPPILIVLGAVELMLVVTLPVWSYSKHSDH